ncbi:LLM class flavin-dependent oxidoreductase [Amycolatopsis pigmentata]|uniref:LLM class flavin-dependent oxidoreductase n=1 Tax=Amycolatopsis pigmentata TaxID=450801 RepID=A0ABW5FX74_9PSEU
MVDLGVIFRPQLPLERLRAMARAADEAGLAELWLWEDCFFDGGIATAAAALAWTGRLRVGVGVLPLPLRAVTLTAMEAASLHRLFPDRFILGGGHGVQEWMGQAGVRVDSPLTLLREYLTALRALLRGETVSTTGRYVRLTDVALERPPATPLPVLTAATGPRTLRLAGEVADGTVLTAATRPDTVRRARALIGEAGRTDPHRVVVYLHAAAGPDATARMRAELDRWREPMLPEYAREVTASTVAEAVANLAEAGADSVVLQPTADETDPAGFARWAAEEVRPLVS